MPRGGSVGSDYVDTPAPGADSGALSLRQIAGIALALVAVGAARRWAIGEAPSSTVAAEERKAWAERCATWWGHVRSLLSTLFLLSLVAVVGWEATRDVVVIDNIQVPPDLEKDGYTPAVIAQRLGDQIHTIQDGALTEWTKFGLETGWSQADIQVPGGNLSLSSISRFLRHLIGRPEKRIGGEIVRDSGSLWLMLRTSEGERTIPIREPAQTLAVDDLIRRAALEASRIVQPLVLAAYLVRTAGSDEGPALDAIQICLDNASPDDDAWAFNLWGLLLARDGDRAGAIAKYQQAIALQPDFVLPRLNWADLLKQSGEQPDLEQARDLLLQAHARNTRHLGALVALGDVDVDLADLYRGPRRAASLDEARRYYQEAFDADPHLGRALVGLGRVELRRVELGTNRFAEAEADFRRAIMLQYRQPYAWANLGLSLSDERDFDGAIAAYREAVTLQPNFTEAHLLWGNALWSKGDLWGAVHRYLQAAPSAQAYDYAADGSEALGDNEVAREFRRFAARSREKERARP